jgi:PKD repeat protein
MFNSKPRSSKPNNLKTLCYVKEIAALFCILFFASGCDLFGSSNSSSDAKVKVEAVVESPQSSFNISAQLGKAPLTVSYTDTSTNGSAMITTWAWDFGDGSASAEQNPQYIYQTAGSYDVSLTVTSSDGNDYKVMVSAITVVPADIEAKLTIVDEKGLALSGVTVTSEIFDIQSQEVNQYTQLLVNSRPSEAQGLLRLKKEGYLDGLVFLNGNQINSTEYVTMLSRLPVIIFDGEQGGELIGKDGASVTIPDFALVKPDGSMVTGEVELYITPVDIRDDILAFAFPGSYYGIPTEGEVPVGQDAQQQLISYGVVEYYFFQNGEKLQLKEGVTASLEMPIGR